MPAKACIVEKFPGGDIDVIVGDKVPVSLRVKNCGNEKGIFYSDIRKDGRSFVSRYNESLNVNSITSIGKDLTMPSGFRVQLDFYGGHAEGSTWHEDFHSTVYLHPRAPRACAVEKFPGGDIDVIVGDKVPVSLRMKNCGGASGTFYSEIKKDGSTLVSRYNESLNVNSITSIGKDVTMPDRRVQLDFYGGHTEGGTRKEDFHLTVYLNPRHPPSPATGSLRVTSTPSGANIWVKPSDSLILYSTGHTTPYTIGGLAVGACEVKVTKAGYKDSEVKAVTIIKDQTASVSFTLTVGAPPAGQWSKQDFINELTKRGRIPIEDLPDSVPSGGGWYDMYGNDKYARYLGKECNSKNFGIAIRLKPHSPCSGRNPPTESDCISWEYGNDHYTYGVDGSVPTACAKKALDELYAPPAAKKATFICNLSVRDSADKEVTNLVAGTQYTVKAWLCWVPEGSIPGGPCRLTGCPSGREVPNEELKLFLLGQAAEIAKGTTDNNGYASMFWTPSRSIVGTNSIRLEYKGNAKYNAVESAWKAVNVGTPCKFTVNCVGYDVGTEVHCTEMVHLLGVFWIPAPIPLNVKKKIPSSKKVEFSTADGLKLNKYYAFTAFPKAWTDAVIENEVYVCSGDKTITITKVGIVERKLCSFFGIDPTSNQCTMFFAEFSDPVFVANTISVITKHEDLAGNHKDPEVLDYVFLPLVILGSLAPEIPVGKICKFGGKGLKLAKKTRATKAFFEQHGSLIDEAVAKGDKTRLNNFASAIEAENLDKALRILEDCVKNPSVGRASIFKRLRGWWRKGDNLLKENNSVTKSEDALGDITKATTKVVDDEAAKVAGRFGEIKKVWTDFCKTPDDVVYLDKHLTGRPADFKVIHNLMRYTKSEYINALKAEKATVPELGTRFNEGLDFVVRHLKEGGEPSRYATAINALPSSERAAITRNLRSAGQGKVASLIEGATELGKSINTPGVTKGANKIADDLMEAAGGTEAEREAGRNIIRELLLKGKLTPEEERWVKNLNRLKQVAAEEGAPMGDIPVPRKGKIGWLLDFLERKHGKSGWLQRHWKKLLVAFLAYEVVSETLRIYFLYQQSSEEIIWGPGMTLGYWPKDRYDQATNLEWKAKNAVDRIEKLKNELWYNYRIATQKGVAEEKFVSLKTECKEALGTEDKPGPVRSYYLFLKEQKGEMEVPDIGFKMIGPFPFVVMDVKTEDKLLGHYNDLMTSYERLMRMWDDWCAKLQELTLDGYVLREFPIESDSTKSSMPALRQPKFSSVMQEPGKTTWQATISWQEPVLDGLKVTKYELVNGVTGRIITVLPSQCSGGACSVVVKGLLPNTTDSFFVRYTVQTQSLTGIANTMTSIPSNSCIFDTGVVPVAPEACFKYDVRPNKVVNFDASCSKPSGEITKYRWDFGDKTSGTGINTSHTYAATGKYTVTLTVTSPKGTDTATQTIEVITAVGGIKCYCEPAEYCDRHADIFVDDKKVGVTKGSGYTYIKDQTPGVHTVKYNLLDVMECTGSATVVVDKDVDFKGQLKSKLPQSQSATVTEIIDGDSIRTNITDALPAPSGHTHQEIRIVGYDAYECHVYPSDCTTFGKYAYEELKKLIPTGTSITLKIDQWLPLGAHNRVIAGVFVGTKDIAAEMLKSCLVSITEKKYRDRYYWISRTADGHWPNYERIWCDPTKEVTSPEHKPEIIDVNTPRRTFKIKNNWLTLWFLTEFVDKWGSSLGKSPRGQIGEGRTSTDIAYFAGTYKIDLYARVDEKDDWTLVDTKYITAAPPTTKAVTFRAVPSGASVTVTKVTAARSALQPLKKLKKSLKKVRSM